MGQKISNAVELALARLPGAGDGAAPAPTRARRSGRRWRAPTSWGAGEARSGRSMDALLAAYRVGARVSWRHMSASAVRAGLTARAAGPLRRAGVRLHRPAVGRQRGRARRRAGHHRPGARALPGAAGRAAARRCRRARRPAGGGRAGRLAAAAHPDRGGPARGQGARRPGLAGPAARCGPPRTCPAPTSTLVVLLVPDADGRSRPALLRSLDGRDAVVGPARPWAAGGRLVRAGLPRPRAAPRTPTGPRRAGHRRAAGRPGAPGRRRRAGRPARAGARTAGRPEPGGRGRS